MVPVGALQDADSPRSSGEDAEHVQRLAELAQWPPVTVHRPTMRVIDGMHRLRAARLLGQTEIAVRFFDGQEAEVFALAVRLNVRHGLPLSLSDRKAAADRILASHPDWSDRLVASVAGLAAKTVADIRRGAQAGAPGAPGGPGGPGPPGAHGGQQAEARIGRDGRVRRLSSAEGRRKAGELIREQPGLSLRQVARAAGISPETVRDVRNRLSSEKTSAAKPGGGPADRRSVRTRAAATGRGARPVPDLGTALQRLTADTSLRLTRTGRTLLKLLDAHAVSEERLAGIIDIVPANCRNAVAQAALECAAAWWKFADRLDRSDQEPADGGSS